MWSLPKLSIIKEEMITTQNQQAFYLLRHWENNGVVNTSFPNVMVN